VTTMRIEQNKFIANCILKHQ